MKHKLTEEEVVAMASNQTLAALFTELKELNLDLVNGVVRSFLKLELVLNTLESFRDGFTRFPHQLPVGRKTMADYPQILNQVMNADTDGLYNWLGVWTQDEEHYKIFTQQLTLRNIHHFYQAESLGNFQFGAHDLMTLRSEIAAGRLDVKTKWLYRLYDGLQVCVIELYAIEMFVK